MYTDSVGNKYEKLPSKPPVHHAKKTQSGREGRKGRNKTKCERYRAMVGRPNGPGKPGNKAGKNKIKTTN